MKLELQSTASFLVHVLRGKGPSELQLQKFFICCMKIMYQRMRNCWFPENPLKGSGFRCICINTKIDPIIEEICKVCCLSSTIFHIIFPLGIIICINPKEVSYCIGENGQICVIYEENMWQPFLKLIPYTNYRKKWKLFICKVMQTTFFNFL